MKDAQLEVSGELKEIKKLKESDLEVTVDKKLLEFKKSRTKEVQSMAVWIKSVSGNANKKHSGGSSQDMDVEEAAVIPVISAPAENSSQSSSSSDPPTELPQTAPTSVEKVKAMPKQKKKLTSFLVSTGNANIVCCR